MEIDKIKDLEQIEEACVTIHKGWVPYNLSFDSVIFPYVQNEIKKVEPKQESIEIKLLNNKRSKLLKKKIIDKYKIDFKWYDNEISELDIYKYEGE